MKKFLVSLLALLAMVGLITLSALAEKAKSAAEPTAAGATEEVASTLEPTIAADATEEAATMQIANPWITSTKGEVALELGFGIKVDAPAGFVLREVAYCVNLEAVPNAARLAYMNGDDMFRVHVIKQALTPMDTWKAIEKDGIAAYYDGESNCILYEQNGCSILVDVATYTEEQLVDLVGCVTLEFPEGSIMPITSVTPEGDTIPDAAITPEVTATPEATTAP